MRFKVPALTTLTACLTYFAAMRKPVLTWGATEAEAEGQLPGDELMADWDGGATRAISVDAPADCVWPWLAQMGPSPRGGAYTYDWIENVLGLNMHSVNRVLEEYQHPVLGEAIKFGGNTMRLAACDPPGSIAWLSEDGNWLWSFTMIERDGRTRLVSRNRYRLPTIGVRVIMLGMEPASLVMERKMLKGIKSRAERLWAQRSGNPCPH